MITRSFPEENLMESTCFTLSVTIGSRTLCQRTPGWWRLTLSFCLCCSNNRRTLWASSCCRSVWWRRQRPRRRQDLRQGDAGDLVKQAEGKLTAYKLNIFFKQETGLQNVSRAVCCWYITSDLIAKTPAQWENKEHLRPLLEAKQYETFILNLEFSLNTLHVTVLNNEIAAHTSPEPYNVFQTLSCIVSWNINISDFMIADQSWISCVWRGVTAVLYWLYHWEAVVE